MTFLLRTQADMENVPSKPSAARVFILYSGKFLVWTYMFLLQMAKILSSVLYQAMRGKIILGWVNFPVYVKLPKLGKVNNLGNFTQPG